MDEISTKYILFAVSLFLVIIIVTAVISSYSSVQDVYEQVLNTNISIQDRFDNLTAMYDSAELNGVDLINTLKKYEDDENVEIYYPGKTKTPPANEVKDAISTLYLDGCTESEYINSIMSEDLTRLMESMSIDVVMLKRAAPNIASFKYNTKFSVEVEENNNNYEIIFTEI